MTHGTCKPDFGTPNCPVGALRYYHRCLTECPELRKGRRCLCIQDTTGQEFVAASVSRWICTTIGDSHATLQNSKSIPGKVIADEVRAVATSL